MASVLLFYHTCTGYFQVVGMKMATYTYFGAAVRDAVEGTLACPPGCVALNEALKKEFEDEGVTVLHVNGGQQVGFKV